jgi:tetratricopeptide (TPR) repeat protein
MAAYLNVVLPITITFFLLQFAHSLSTDQKDQKTRNVNASATPYFIATGFFLLALLFYADLIFTNTRAGTIAFWVANVFFWGMLFYKNLLSRSILLKSFLTFTLFFLLFHFIFGTTFPRTVQSRREISGLQWTGITGVGLIGAFLLLLLVRFWYADKAYALGSNLSRIQEYQQSYLKLGEAVSLRPSEPTFKDEFATNNAMIAVLLLLGEDASTSAEAKQQAELLTRQAITLSTEDVTNHPNNITFWKNRVRMFYALSQADSRYLPAAVEAVEHVRELAPTDAKVLYNLGALYRENKDPKRSAEVLEETVRLKPDYRDAYYALAIAYNDMAVNAAGQVVRPEFRQKAVDALQYILNHIAPNDKETEQLLTSWNAL